MFSIQQLLAFMKQNDASDLYLTVGRAPSFKISGTVKAAGKEALSSQDVESLARAILNDTQWNELKTKREYNNAFFDPEIGRYRFNYYFQKENLAMVIRKIETKIRSK